MFIFVTAGSNFRKDFLSCVEAGTLSMIGYFMHTHTKSIPKHKSIDNISPSSFVKYVTLFKKIFQLYITD